MSSRIFRPCERSVLHFEIRKASLALRIESRLEQTFSMWINCVSLAVRKCSAVVVGLDLLLGLSMVRRCSLKRSFKRRLISPMSVFYVTQSQCNLSTSTNLGRKDCMTS